jgi:hypothetical protein
MAGNAGIVSCLHYPVTIAPIGLGPVGSSKGSIDGFAASATPTLHEHGNSSGWWRHSPRHPAQEQLGVA